MIKLVVASLWIAAVTLGAVFYAFETNGEADAATAAEDGGPEPAFGGLDYVRADVLSIPRMEGGVVEGYFLARLVYTAGAERLRQLSLPAEALLTDAAYTHLYDNPQIDFSQVESLDLDAFRTQLRDAVNARIGEDLIEEVLIEQIDYLSKADIRRASFRGWETQFAPVEEDAPEDAGAGH